MIDYRSLQHLPEHFEVNSKSLKIELEKKQTLIQAIGVALDDDNVFIGLSVTDLA